MTLAGIALRLAILLLVVALASWAVHLLREALDMQITPRNEARVHQVLMVGLAAYIGLLALPFVPGAEIGFAMLTAFGAAIAPLVWGATVLALMLAFAIGRLLPPRWIVQALEAVRLRKAAALIARSEGLDREARLALLLEGSAPGVVQFACRHRYIALALAVNVPGNSVIGGGGGIAMMAGLSGLFAPLPTLAAFALAVAPVPLVVMATGGIGG